MTSTVRFDTFLVALCIGLAAIAPLATFLASRSPPAVLAAFGLVAIPLLVRFRREIKPDLLGIGLCAALVGAMVLASFLAAVDWRSAINVTAEMAGLILAGVLGASLAWRHKAFASDRTKGIIAGIFCAGLILLTIELATGWPVYRLVRGLSMEAYVDAWNLDRTALVMSVLLWPAVACLPSRFSIPAAVILPGILLTAAAMTESQTVPLVCLLSFLGYWLARMAPKVLAWAGAGISALYILTAPWIFVAIYQPAIEQFRDWTSASAGARLEIWRAVGGLSLERPVFGWGPEAIGKMEGIFSEDDFFMNRSNHLTAHHPHNFALQAWLDLGAIGAIVVTALIILAFFRISHLPRPLAAAGVGMMTALIVGGSLSPGLWQAWWISAICLAVCQFIIATRSDQPFAIAQIGASRPL